MIVKQIFNYNRIEIETAAFSADGGKRLPEFGEVIALSRIPANEHYSVLCGNIFPSFR